MSRVLLVCPEPLGHRHPAGVGIRFVEIARALRDEGHQLIVLSPDSGAVDGCETAGVDPMSLRNSSQRSDVALIQGHIGNDYFAHAADIPTAVDLYDPYVIENLHYFKTHGPGVFDHDRRTLLLSIERGDFFLCASDAQRHFYLGMLLACGKLTPQLFSEDATLDNLISIVPFGVQPLVSADPTVKFSHRLIFGGIYDWYEPRLAIDAIALARRTLDDLTLTFTHHPNPGTTPQGKTAEAVAYVAAKGYDGFVNFEPWTPYEDRKAFFDRFGAALITFPPSLETDLAMRTRIFDFLWAGLPVISSPAPGTDPILKQHDAGRTASNNSPEGLAQIIEEVFTLPGLQQQLSDNARRWAGTHQWPVLLEPLLRFCRHPRKARQVQKTALYEQSLVRPSLRSQIRKRLARMTRRMSS
ncbi:MAG TPA: glycosyltransferase family 4 protein [Thermoanaerobaculia bacterium]|nr:glycosyltransferase family 4 protein [Thermoanaerobaculia bacterium]